MPRQARKHAESGIYHVMFRGIDRQLIFEDKQDYLFLLEIIQGFYKQMDMIAHQAVSI